MTTGLHTAAQAAKQARVSTSGPGSLRRAQGFNLLELLLAVAIGGVVLATALPSFQSSLQNQRVRSAASDLHLSLVLARSEAIKRNRNIDVSTSSAWTGGWSVLVNGTSTILRANDPLPTAVQCSTDTDASAEACPSSITFGRSGRPTGFLEFRAFLTDNALVQARCVSITPSGRPRVVADTDNDPSDGCD